MVRSYNWIRKSLNIVLSLQDSELSGEIDSTETNNEKRVILKNVHFRSSHIFFQNDSALAKEVVLQLLGGESMKDQSSAGSSIKWNRFGIKPLSCITSYFLIQRYFWFPPSIFETKINNLNLSRYLFLLVSPPSGNSRISDFLQFRIDFQFRVENQFWIGISSLRPSDAPSRLPKRK